MSEKISRRAAIAGLPVVAAAASLTALPAVADADPIFALIEAHWRAYQEFEAAPVYTEGEGSEEEKHEAYDKAAELWDDASDAEQEAVEALITTRPTTRKGAVAAIDYVRGFFAGEHEGMRGRTHQLFCGNDDSLVTFLATISEALKQCA